MKWLSFLTLILGNICGIRVCEHCQYFRPSHIASDIDLSKCSLFAKNVSGRIIYDYADVCRLNESKCVKNATHFKPRFKPRIELQIDK